jgi:hypothetical protein
MTEASKTKQEVIASIDAQLIDAGMASYSEVLGLLEEARRLGLSFDIGSAYIRRGFIDMQDILADRISEVRAAARDAS